MAKARMAETARGQGRDGTGVGANAPDRGGNAERLARTGLADKGADARDYGLDGPFAGMLLDAMPEADAREAARDHMENPAVRAWLEENGYVECFPEVSGAAESATPEAEAEA
jgi:hypothetical protein